jgi:hypothetical protein
MSRVDENHEYVAMAATDDANLTPSPLKIDPVTGRLEIAVSVFSGSPVANTVLPTDDNCSGVAEAVDTNGVIRPLQTNSNGELLIDLTIE